MYRFLYLFLVALLQLTSLHSAPLKLSVCSIFHNEDRFLKDWIDFHLAMGVQRFYLYNHQSSDNFKEVLQPYIDKRQVKLIDWDYSYEDVSQWNDIQCGAYNDCLKRFGRSSQWIAFIDTDEYVYSPKSVKIPKILKKFKSFAAVSANWVFYGTSNIYKLDPKIPLIRQLVLRHNDGGDPNHHVKSIVQPSKVIAFRNPHFAELKPNQLQVTENKESFIGPFSNTLSVKMLRINHYWTRDRLFFEEEKMKRYRSWSKKPDAAPFDVSALSQVRDDAIYKVYKRLKK